jgi:hypothetical protein
LNKNGHKDDAHLKDQILRKEGKFLVFVDERDWVALKSTAGSDSPRATKTSQNANLKGVGNGLSLYEFASPPGSTTNTGQLKNDFKHLTCDLDIRQVLKEDTTYFWHCLRIMSVMDRQNVEVWKVPCQ